MSKYRICNMTYQAEWVVGELAPPPPSPLPKLCHPTARCIMWYSFDNVIENIIYIKHLPCLVEKKQQLVMMHTNIFFINLGMQVKVPRVRLMPLLATK